MSGFILRDLFPFDTAGLKCYRTAGYRGVIGQNFHAVRGLVHLFEKGVKLTTTTTITSKTAPSTTTTTKVGENVEGGLDMALLNDLFAQGDEVERLHALYFKKRENNPLFDALQNIVSSSLNEKFEDLEIKCPKFEFQSPTNSAPNFILNHQNVLFLNGNNEGSDELLCDHEYGYYAVNKNNEITPFNHPLTHHINFSFNTNKSTIPPEDLEENLIRHICSQLFLKFETSVVDCLCNASSTNCPCLTTRSSPCCRPYLKTFSSLTSYDADIVPNFVEDIPQDFWTSFCAEIVVTDVNESGDVAFNRVDGECYELDALERKFFGRVDQLEQTQNCSENNNQNNGEKHMGIDNNGNCDDKNNDNDNHTDNNRIRRKLIVAHGRCVATITTKTDDHNNKIITLVFNSNEIFLLSYVSDLRYLWSNDTIAQQSILQHLHDDHHNKQITQHKLTNMLIKHTLCYRHDLCFWLNDNHSEADLLRCVTVLCGCVVHSVRLLKVLRHVETGCTSYCYRIIYNRVDGPLSHEESVVLQNNLRLFMLHQGYMLR